MKNNTYFSFLATIILFVSLQFSIVNSQAPDDSCNSTLSINAQLPFTVASFNCNPVWTSRSFILRYAQTGKSQWSFVLSAPNTNNYIGMGFSSNGMMVGSNAIVGWVGADSLPVMKSYFLGGQTPNQVVINSENLQVANSSMVVTKSRIYMAFQLNTDTPPAKRLIYAVGPDRMLPSAPNFLLTRHADHVSTAINYATGVAETKGNSYASLKRSHGILNMFGWGILLPIGAMAARYLRQHDPIWFYSHITIQTVGFVLGAAGVLCGFVLNHYISANVNRHKSIGIIVLFLGCLQVIAFLVRPDKTSKVRKYWNWYHYGLGRLLIFLAAVNVFYGIHLADAGKSWNAGFAVVIVVFFIATLVLELRLWMRK